MMEKRFVLTHHKAAKIAAKIVIESVPIFIVDEYTGEKRIRKVGKETVEKEYTTPVKGIIYRFCFICELDNIPCWLEIKWTEKTIRWEMEFEETVPDEFINKENIPGWDILNN